MTSAVILPAANGIEVSPALSYFSIVDGSSAESVNQNIESAVSISSRSNSVGTAAESDQQVVAATGCCNDDNNVKCGADVDSHLSILAGEDSMSAKPDFEMYSTSLSCQLETR